MPKPFLRELYFQAGIAYLPKILELADRNRAHSTYGCFDRSFWHYRTSDFPSGMYQECVLPLAIVYGLDHPRNPYFQQERIKELVWAGIDFARRSSHRDGSCDDYFPYERAAGAAAFSLFACTEASLLLQWKSSEFIPFFLKRARYLSRHGYDESGTLSNHKALIVLALYNVFLITEDPAFKREAEEKRDHLLKLQTSEGWFPEYGGCDPGYLTFTIDFLAKYFQKSQDERVLPALRKAIEFASYFLHPDGSYGGEYGSRNTFHFLPHGFELMGARIPKAASMADRFLSALEAGNRSYLDDDRIFCHYVYNFLQAYLNFCPRQDEMKLSEPADFTRSFEESGLLVKRSKEYYAVISSAKGGVAKIFRGTQLCWSDCGLVGKTRDGGKFISQAAAPFQTGGTERQVIIEGSCYEYKEILFSPLSFLIFRLGMILGGRFLPPNLIRSFLQRKAILRKMKKFPLKFKKVFSFEGKGSIEYSLSLENPRIELERLWIGSDPTFIYVATSQPYQTGTLKSWVDLSAILPELNQKRYATFRHDFL